MAWTQADVDALKAAMAAAGTSASIKLPDGYEIGYTTTTNALNLLSAMERDVASAAASMPSADPAQRPVRAFRIRHRSGY